jgi:hypothetical protein
MASAEDYWSHGERHRGALKQSENFYPGGQDGPRRFYNVKQAAEFLGCCERKLREEIATQKITYRRGPGGIVFTLEDLLERLRPSGGPAAKKNKKNRKAVAGTHDQMSHKPKMNGIRGGGQPIAMGSESTVFLRFIEDHVDVAWGNVTSCNFR